MIACFVCGSQLEDDAKACSVCGTSLAAVSDADEPPPEMVPVAPVSGARHCPACRKQYEATYADTFCECGAELVGDDSPDLQLAPVAETPPPLLKLLLPDPEETLAGVPRLVVYSSDRKPVHTLVLDRDVTRIGRTDAVRGDFVDLDLGQFVDEATARKVSRKHAVILRSRETQTFTLRPLARNTGTQIGNELAVELQDYPLTDGTRIVLGGAVRLKFQTS
jgi:hypothetical protein